MQRDWVLLLHISQEEHPYKVLNIGFKPIDKENSRNLIMEKKRTFRFMELRQHLNTHLIT